MRSDFSGASAYYYYIIIIPRVADWSAHSFKRIPLCAFADVNSTQEGKEFMRL
jgi:hypothetical protein